MSTRLLGRPTGTSPIVSARHSSFPRAWSPNEARWEPRRGVIPELLLDRTALWGRQQPASLDKTLIARGYRPRGQPLGAECHSSSVVSFLAPNRNRVPPRRDDLASSCARLSLASESLSSIKVKRLKHPSGPVGLWHWLLGGQRPSLADYVTGIESRDRATAAAG